MRPGRTGLAIAFVLCCVGIAGGVPDTTRRCVASDACRARGADCRDASRAACMAGGARSAARCERRARRACRRGMRATCRKAGVCGATGTQPGSDCIVAGCSGQVCADVPVPTTCEMRAWYPCFRTARCERQASGACGWTPTPELEACLRDSGGPRMP